MLQTRMEAWKNAKQQEWRREGKQEGKADTLLRLLQRRFGQPSDQIMARVVHAKLEQIENWSDRILGARSVDDIFAN